MREEFIIAPAFVKAVHAVVATIPVGKVMTYGQVAELSGEPGAAREVGVIMSRVRPEQNLPCHRVVNKTGALSPEFAFGGKAQQRALLEAEGVLFAASGSIDMRRCQWHEVEQLFF